MTTSVNTSETDLKNIHFETLEWKSSIMFIENEILFIDVLLNSYVFEPNTPNLFERLQGFRKKITIIKNKIKILHEDIRKHENVLGGILECDTVSCDSYYYEEHITLNHQFNEFDKEFRQLKYDVFNYTSGILKHNKK